MNLKSLLLIPCVLFAFLFLILFSGHDYNWQFFVEKNIGSKSILQENNNLFFYKNLLLFSDQEKTIFAINNKNGDIEWTFQGQNYSPYEIKILKDRIYIASFDAHIYCLDKKNGYTLWSFAIPENTVPDTEVVTDENDQFVFFADRAGRLFALDKKTGQVIWTKKFKRLDNKTSFVKNSIHFGFIQQDENFLYIRNFPQREFVILKKTDGKEVFKLEDIMPEAGAAVILDNLLVVVPKSQAEYIAINKISFDVSWSIHSNSSYPLKIFSDKNNNDSVLILDNQILYKVNKNTGEIEWDKNLQPAAKIYSTNSLSDLILLEDSDPLKFSINLKALSWEKGQIKWQVGLPSAMQEFIIEDQKLILSTVTNDLLIIDLNTHKIINRLKTQGLVLKLIPYDKKIIAICADSGRKALIYYLDINKNSFDWEYKGDNTINPKEIYQHQDRLYYLNEKNFIIESIKISGKTPNTKLISKINYKLVKNFSEGKLVLDYQETKENLGDKTKEFFLKLKYVLSNIKNIFSFDVEQKQKNLHEYEIIISHDQNLYGNYFKDVDIKCVLTGNNNETYEIKGYYFDYNTWKVKFFSGQNATWRWKLTIVTPFYKTHRSGTFNTKSATVKKIKIIDDNFVTGDNEIFIPIGIQDAIIDRNYDGNPLDQMGFAQGLEPQLEEEDFKFIPFKQYVELYKKEANLNIFRVGIDNWAPSLLRNLDPENFSINVNDAKIIDSMINDLRENNYKIIMTIFGFNSPIEISAEFQDIQKRKSITMYLDYIIARYSPFVDIWEISNETSIPREWENFVSDYLVSHDQYHGLITTNWEQKQLRNSNLLSIHWYSPIVKDNLALEEQFNYLEKKHNDWNKTILISELGFKDLSYFENSSQVMRSLSWISIFKKMGIIFWNQPLGILENKDNANIYLGEKERKYLKNLQNFLPVMRIPVEKKFTIFVKENLHLYLLKNNQYLLGYLLNLDKNNQKNLSINLNIDKNGYFEWFDPSDNTVIESFNVNKGEVKINVPEISTDLAFKIKYY